MEENEEGISFKEFVDRCYGMSCYLLGRKIWIISAGLLCGILLALTAAHSPVLYEANTSFSLDEEGAVLSNTGGSSYLSMAKMLGLGIGQRPNTSELVSPVNLKVLLRSRRIMYDVMMKKVPDVDASDSILLIELFLRTYPDLILKDDVSIFLAKQHIPFGNYKPRDSIFINICDKLINPEEKFFELKEAMDGASIYLFKVNTEDQMLSYYVSSILLKVLENYYVAHKTERIRNQIVYVESELRKASSRYGKQLENTLSTNMPNLNMGVYSADAQLMKRKEELALKRNTYWSLLSELESLKLREKRETPVFKIIDNVVLPLAVQRKSVIKYGTMGALMGAFIMIFFLLVVGYFKAAYYAKSNK